MGIGSKIREFRLQKGLTQGELASLLGVASQTISRYEMNQRDVRQDMIKKIARALDVTPGMLMGWADPEVEAVPVPTLGEVAGGPPIDALEDAYTEFSISKALAQRGTYATFRIKGDSMAPKINDGDVVLVQYGPDVSSGDVAIIYMYDYQVTCKKIFFLEGGKVKLQAYNEDVFSTKVFTKTELEEINFQVLGKVVLVVRDEF